MSYLLHNQPSPAQVRDALRKHLARKLGWSGKTADLCLAPLTNDDIARCLTVDTDETRTALYALSCRALGQAGALDRQAA